MLNEREAISVVRLGLIESIEEAKKSQPTGKGAEIFAVICAMKVVDRFTRKDKADESNRSS